MTTRLRVTSIERYHLSDETPQNPNVIGCDLHVRGDVDLDIATAALRKVAERHPMISARLNGQAWDIDPSNADLLKWEICNASDSDLEHGDLRIIDLADGLACRFIMRRHDAGAQLSFRLHHAAADGGGGLQSVADWLVTYHRLQTCSDRPKSRAMRPELLNQRNNLRLLSRAFISKLWVQPIAILGATKFLFRRVQPLKPLDPIRSQKFPKDFTTLRASLSADQMTRLKQEAESADATINEMILRALFLALHDFRKAYGYHRTGEWLRLIVPVSIRDFSDRGLSASNRASMVQLDRTDRDFNDPKGLLWGLNYELTNIRKWNLEKTFLLLVRCFSIVPGWIDRIAAKDICRATSVLTNLGSPFDRLKLERVDGKLQSGNLLVEDVDLVVPLRRKTPIGLATLRYAGEQKICLHFDPVEVDHFEAEILLEKVVQHLTIPAVEGASI